MFSFLNPLNLLLAIPALALLIWATRRKRAFGHTQIDAQKDLPTFSIVGKMPVILTAASLILMICAMGRPVVPQVKDITVVQTRDFCIAVDISGSMTMPVRDQNIAATAATQAGAPSDSSSQSDKPKSRLDVAEPAIASFVNTRQGDRVCLMYFDDEAYYAVPLTDDLKIVLKRNEKTHTFNGGGTNFEGPNDHGAKMGPLQGMINHFKERGQAKTKIMIMVTDGEDNISPQRFDEITKQMKDAHIKLYVLGVAEGWVNNSAQTQDLRRLSEGSGGRVMVVGSNEEMQKGIDEINSMEKSRVETDKVGSYRDIFFYFLEAAALCWLLLILIVCFVREDV